MTIEFEHGRTTLKMWPYFTKDEVEAVICNLRPSDQHEAACLGYAGEAAHEHCREIVGSTPVSYVAYYDGRPVFMWGVIALTARHVVLWGFGTSDTPKVIPAITRYVRRQWLADMARAGVSRIEARLPLSCRNSLQWLKSCGMRHECEVLGATTNGEPLVQLSYTWIDT